MKSAIQSLLQQRFFQMVHFHDLFTVFAPLNKLINQLPDDKLQRWERLWMVSDARVDRIHPLIYSHPVTGLKVDSRKYSSFWSEQPP